MSLTNAHYVLCIVLGNGDRRVNETLSPDVEKLADMLEKQTNKLPIISCDGCYNRSLIKLFSNTYHTLCNFRGEIVYPLE